MYEEPAPLQPFWSVADDEEEFRNWWTEFVEATKNQVQQRFTEDLRKRDFYEGFQEIRSLAEKFPRDREVQRRSHRTKIVVNRTAEVVEAITTQILRNKASVVVLPQNSQEYNDKVAAKTSKQFIDHLWSKLGADRIQYKFAKENKIYGNAAIVVDYDFFAGDIVQGAEPSPGLMTEVLDPNTGEPIEIEDGKPLMTEYVQRTGEVSWRVVPRRRIVFPPGEECVDSVPYFIEIGWADKLELAAKYPHKAQEILYDNTPYSSGGFHSGGDLLDDNYRKIGDNQVWTYKLYHKGTEFLDSGRYLFFTSNTILENKPLIEAVGHKDLPLVWISDWDIPDQIYSKSVVDRVMMLQVIRNNIISIMYTNLALASHIYWIVHTASKVKVGHLRNAPSVIHYSGAIAPRIEQFRSIGQELFAAVDLVDRMIDRTVALHEINFGQVPKRMDSGAGVAELDELQARQMHTPLRKHDEAVSTLGRLSLATAGHFYQQGDTERFIRVVGKNNKFSMKALNTARLGGPYDVMVQRASGLAESKSGKIQQIKQLQQAFPNLFPKEHILDMLELGNLEQYYDYATVALEAAQRENEILAEGGVVADPVQWEDSVVHWFEHVKFMQSASFKEDITPAIRTNFLMHLQATEGYIIQMLVSNPVFQQKFMTEHPAFPLVTPPEVYAKAMMVAQQALAGGVSPQEQAPNQGVEQ
jgi:hypothetical protein